MVVLYPVFVNQPWKDGSVVGHGGSECTCRHTDLALWVEEHVTGVHLAPPLWLLLPSSPPPYIPKRSLVLGYVYSL